MTRKQFTDFIQQTSGFDPRESAMIAEAVEATRDLLVQNWTKVKEERELSDEAKVAVTVKHTITVSGPKPFIHSDLSVARAAWKDDRESYVEDASQEDLPFNVTNIETVDVEIVNEQPFAPAITSLPSGPLRALPESTTPETK